MDNLKQCVLTIIILIFITTVELSILILNKFKKDKNPKKIVGKHDIKVLDISNEKNLKDKIKKCLDNSVPIILKNASKEIYKEHMKYSKIKENNKSKNKPIINVHYSLNIPETKKFIKKYINKTIISTVQIGGNYITGPAHIDTSPSYNFYYLLSGKKEVIILPYQYAKYLNMKSAIDNIYVTEDKNDDKWLKKIPGYWKGIIEKNDILIFPSSKCIHKFTNLLDDCEAFTTRLFTTDVVDIILKNDIFNIKLAYQYSKMILTSNCTHVLSYN